MNSNHNNKETFKLLNVSESESGSEIPDLSVNVPRRKIKVKRKYRPGNDHKMDRDKRCCSLATMWKVLGVILLLSLLVAIVTLLVHLYDRNDLLNKKLQEVQSESRQFPAEFHDIHSRLKTLEANSTFFWDSVVKINSDIATLNKDVTSLKQTADSLSKSIAAAPQIETLPKDVASLQNDVASMGSKINDLEIKVKEIKEEANSGSKANSVEALQEMRTMIDNLNQSTSARIQETAEGAAAIKGDVRTLKNSSMFLESRVEQLQNKSLTLESVAEHLQGLMAELLNHSDHMLQAPPATAQSVTKANVTLEQLTSHVKNLTKIYHALVYKVGQLESESQHDLNLNLLNTNVTDGLEEMMKEALRASELKMLTLFNNESLRLYFVEQQLQLLMSELNSERNETSQLLHFNMTNVMERVIPQLHKLPSLGTQPDEYLLPTRTNLTKSQNGGASKRKR